MSIPFVDHIDLNRLETQNRVIQNLATDPATPVEGLEWYITTAGVKTPYFWNGTEKVPYDARKLAAGTLPITLLTVDPLARANHTGTQLAATISDFDATVTAKRLDQFAAPTAPVNLNNQRLTNVAAPTTGTDGANRDYVDQVAAAAANVSTIKGTVRAAVASNITIASPGATLDGVTAVANDVFLLTGQTTGTENGPYTWNGPAVPMTRAPNWDTTGEAVLGSYWIVREGAQADKFALLSNDSFTLGTSTATFVYTGAASAYTNGLGLTLTGNQFAIDTAVVARKFSQTIGDGSATSFTVTHNLGTQDVEIFTRQASAPFSRVYPLERAASANTVTVSFASAPALNAYRVTVVG